MDAEGDVYVVDTGNHRIQKFSSDGVFLRQWKPVGHNALKNPQGIALSQNNLVIADTGNHRVLIFHPENGLIQEIGSEGGGEGQFTNPEGVVAAANGDLYVADTGNHRIQQFAANGDFIRQWGRQGDGMGEFNRPGGINLFNNQLIVADTNNHRIQLFDLNGQFVKAGGKAGDEKGNFNNPSAIAIDLRGGFYIADTGNHRIQQFVFDNQELRANRVWGSSGSKEGQFRGPADVAVDDTGNIFVVERGNDRIQLFTSDGRYVNQWGDSGNAIGQFNNPSSLSLSPDQAYIYVADTGNHRIQQFSTASDHAFIRTWGERGRGDGQFQSPTGLAVAKDGSVYVADNGNHRIQQFSADGVFVRAWGQEGTVDGELTKPYALDIATDGGLYVTEEESRRVQQFGADGVFIRSWSTLVPSQNQLVVAKLGHAGIAIANDGSVVITDLASHQLLQFSAEGQWIRSFGSSGAGAGQFHYPAGLAFGGTGAEQSLVIADLANHRVQKMVIREKINLIASTPTGEEITITHPYKAIVVAGGGEMIGGRINDIWDGTWRIAQKAYAALSNQGFALKNEIRFLTAGDTEIDLDANGEFDDLTEANLENLQHALTEWASDAQDVVVYLADHGGPGTFQLNDTEILTGDDLSSWVEQLDQMIPGRVIVIIEACNSGGFFSYLSNAERYVFSSVREDQAAVISNDGLNSFSYFFWSEIASGAKLKDAFTDARQAMSATVVDGEPRDAQADADGDLQYTAEDLNVLNDYCLGNCNATAALPPTIVPLANANQALNGETTLEFSVTVSALQPLDRVWVLVHRPDDWLLDKSQPVSLTSVDLICDEKNECQGRYSQFDVQGEYRLSFYAMDSQAEVSLPETLTVTQTQGAAISAVQYDEATESIWFRDVIADGVHFQASLQLQNGVFVLTAADNAIEFYDSAAIFDSQTGMLNIPKAAVFGQVYQATLRHLGNFMFQLESAEPVN